MLKLVRFDEAQATPIDDFDAIDASAVGLGHGSGESHVYVVRLGAGGEIGFHEAQFGQLFVVVDGEAWVASPTDRLEVGTGEAVFIERGTVHAKGSGTGVLAVMVQSRTMAPPNQEPG